LIRLYHDAIYTTRELIPHIRYLLKRRESISINNYWEK
jgi:hypothetical protein